MANEKETVKKPEEAGEDGDVEEVSDIPKMALADLKFAYSKASSDAQKAIQEQLMEGIKADNMQPFYRECCADLGWPVDQALEAEMTKANEAKLVELDAAIKDAEENLGEVEVRGAYTNKAKHFCTIGDKVATEKAFAEAQSKAISTGQRIDMTFFLIRLGLFHHDLDILARNIAKADDLMEQGGDWDRRNRLKVYKAMYKLMQRDLKGSAQLFLESVSTFTATEVISYADLIGLTVLLSLVALPRPELKKKVVDGPEIQEVLHQLPLHKKILMSLYNCAYENFFESLVAIDDIISQHRLFSQHAAYYIRELRIMAYSQLLQSYRSVTLASMAQIFGVSVEFVDQELSRFVAAGRLNCKIDKVGGVVETTRPDEKNKQYADTIKKGDLLLNRIQKLSQGINI